jgi:hypothetical protein
MTDAQLDLEGYIETQYLEMADEIIKFWTSSETVKVGERSKTIHNIAKDCVTLSIPLGFTLRAMNHVKHRFNGLPDDEIAKAVTTAYGL